MRGSGRRRQLEASEVHKKLDKGLRLFAAYLAGGRTKTYVLVDMVDNH